MPEETKESEENTVVLPVLSTVQLFAERQRKIASKKQEIASLASMVIADPEKYVSDWGRNTTSDLYTGLLQSLPIPGKVMKFSGKKKHEILFHIFSWNNVVQRGAYPVLSCLYSLHEKHQWST